MWNSKTAILSWFRCSKHALACCAKLMRVHQQEIDMAKVCEVCQRGPRFGNRVSHAHNITKRRWNLNLQTVHAVVKGAPKRIRVCTACIKSGKVQKAA